MSNQEKRGQKNAEKRGQSKLTPLFHSQIIDSDLSKAYSY